MGEPFAVDIGLHQPLRVGLEAYAAARMLPGALFHMIDGDASGRTENFVNGVTSGQMVVLRVLLDGSRINIDTATPASMELQDDPDHVIDVMLGQGGAQDYPQYEEVFNTPAGALSYYQLEVRRLRSSNANSSNANHIQQLQANNAQQAQQLQAQQAQLAQQAQQLQAQQAQLAQQAQQLQAQQAQLALQIQQQQTLDVDKQQLQQRVSELQGKVTNFERLRAAELKKNLDLRREMRALEQAGAREAQVAKLRSRASPAAGASPVAASPRASLPRTLVSTRELRALGVDTARLMRSVRAR